jgi:uncharacterized protein YacL
MSFNKYNRCKNKQNWEIYRKQRNLVNKIKKQSISFPVAFFIPILLISLLTNSSLMGLKINWSVSVLFSFIAFILGWLSSVFMFCEPMSLATFMKKLLNVSTIHLVH